VQSPRAIAETPIRTRHPELDGFTLSCARCRNDARVDLDAAASRCASCEAVTPLDAGLVERLRRQLGALRSGGESQLPPSRLPGILFSLALLAVLAGLILTLEWLGWLDGYSSSARPIAMVVLGVPFAALLIWFHSRRGASTQIPLVRAVCPHSGTRYVQRRGSPLPCPACGR
jgi:hypothetical protein